MKKNYENLKKYLLLALQNTPNDFVFENIKPMLKSALSIVEKVEKKRTKREQNNIMNNAIQISQFNDNQMKNIINNIDSMIKEQEKNIKNLNKNKPSENDSNSLMND